MRALMRKFGRFINNTSGAEFLEVAAIIIGTISLVAIIVAVFYSVQTKIDETGKELDIP